MFWTLSVKIPIRVKIPISPLFGSIWQTHFALFTFYVVHKFCDNFLKPRPSSIRLSGHSASLNETNFFFGRSGCMLIWMLTLKIWYTTCFSPHECVHWKSMFQRTPPPHTSISIYWHWPSIALSSHSNTYGCRHLWVFTYTPLCTLKPDIGYYNLSFTYSPTPPCLHTFPM